VIGGLALAKLTLYLAPNRLYVFHRDSLYYVDSSRYPRLGVRRLPARSQRRARPPVSRIAGSKGPARLCPTRMKADRRTSRRW